MRASVRWTRGCFERSFWFLGPKQTVSLKEFQQAPGAIIKIWTSGQPIANPIQLGLKANWRPIQLANFAYVFGIVELYGLHRNKEGVKRVMLCRLRVAGADNIEQVGDVGAGWAFICHKRCGLMGGGCLCCALVAAVCFGAVACRGRRNWFVVVLGKNVFGEVIYGQAGRQSLELVEKALALVTKLVNWKVCRHCQDVLHILRAKTTVGSLNEVDPAQFLGQASSSCLYINRDSLICVQMSLRWFQKSENKIWFWKKNFEAQLGRTCHLMCACPV